MLKSISLFYAAVFTILYFSTMTWAERIIGFNKSLHFKGKLPVDIHIMNPYKEYPSAIEASEIFYRKYYWDEHPRKLILGINPGRFGAGVTGIPFTDPKRLHDKLGINIPMDRKHEPSSEFIYNMIDAYGGPEAFYGKFYVSAVSPLGFTIDKNGKEVNYNYYDRKDLLEAVLPFIIKSIKRQIKMGVDTDTCVCLGYGKNYNFLCRLNEAHHFFEKIVPLEHPRFIKQYKAKTEQAYINKYVTTLKEI